ncbi:MAG TPA: L-threonylcarbamoyladenylate synthase [Fervidobacterium nodosum]|mgnify:CR=1 FL=1|nr:L-threonylcarbamoyladenylate synthase [Fervidobacterium nodosum]
MVCKFDTKIIKVDDLYNPDISYACEVLKSGGLVAFPTETVYGLGATATNPEAVKKIFQVKGRPADNPLIVHVSSVDEIENIAYLSEKYIDIIKKVTPGPITFVLKKKENIPSEVTAGLETVGVRIPAHPVAQKLINCSGPIAAPSANCSGKPSPTDANAVIEDLNGLVECIIDAGECAFGIESTIVDLTKDFPVVLRPGPITLEELTQLFGVVEFYQLKEGEKPLAPGMKYRHYAPEKHLELVDQSALLEYQNTDVLILCTKETKERLIPNAKNVYIIGELSKPYTIAQNLYRSFRDIDKTNYKYAVIEKLPEYGIFFSIMNRIKKAVSKK